VGAEWFRAPEVAGISAVTAAITAAINSRKIKIGLRFSQAVET
jgi:hypothetical protein